MPRPTWNRRINPQSFCVSWNWWETLSTQFLIISIGDITEELFNFWPTLLPRLEVVADITQSRARKWNWNRKSKC